MTCVVSSYLCVLTPSFLLSNAGGSRIPAIRRLLQKRLLSDLCLSLNPEAAVAHGAAIFATMESKLVPRHELLSALMLDALPYSIGVLVPANELNEEEFVEVLTKDQQLPASGFKTFELSSIDQKGITVPVVEFVGGDRCSFQKIGDFTFLLYKVPPAKLSKLGSTRTVDVGMSVSTDGKFTISVFDWNDPEHLQKRRKYLEQKGVQVADDLSLGVSTSEFRDNILLSLACLALLILYVTVKVIFMDSNEISLKGEL